MPTLTFLFVDQVGSTAQLQALGDDSTAPLRVRLHDILNDAITAHGGEIANHTGDGVMATFTGASEALSAAGAIQSAVSAHNRARPEPEALHVRVGVHAGESARDASDQYFGMPVVIASRLCAQADAGEVFVSDLVRVLVGDRHELTRVGELELKGVGAPVTTFRLVAGEAKRSLPDRLPVDDDVPFVGRLDESLALASAWAEARAGAARTVLVSGEPGVGKTRLVAEFAADAAHGGALVLTGRCDEDAGVAYQPFIEALRQFVVMHRPERLGELLGPRAVELVRLVPELAGSVTGDPSSGEPEQERYELFEAVRSWLELAATRQPLVLVVDDLHWAARPTVLMLRHLMKALGAAPVLVLVTYRDTDLTRTHPLAAALPDLGRLPGTTRLDLRGLSSNELAPLVHGEHSANLLEAIHGETDGNPFFVTEILRHLAEADALEREGGGWRVAGKWDDVPIPQGVREVVGRRLSQLTESANTVLAIAAAVGMDFDLRVVERTSSLSEDEFLAAIDVAEDAQLVSTAADGRYRFAHAIVRHSLYEELSPVRRSRLHRRIGEAIEAIDPSATALLAHHFLSAAGDDTAKGVRYALRAGDDALRSLAFEDAIAWYERGADAVDSDDPSFGPTRLQLLNGLALAYRRLGNLDAPARLWGEMAALAKASGDTHALTEATLGLAGWFRGSGVLVDAVPVLREALDAAPPGDSGDRAQLLGALAARMTDADTAMATARDAMAMADRVGDASARAFAYSSAHAALVNSGPQYVEEALELAGAVRSTAAEANELELLGSSIFSFCFPASRLGRVDVIRREIDWGRDFATRYKNAYTGSAAECYDAMLGLAEDDLDRVDTGIAAAIAWRPRHPNSRAMINAVVFAATRARGNLDAVRGPLGATVDAGAEGVAPSLVMLALRAHWVLLLAELGDGEAVPELEALLDAVESGPAEVGLFEPPNDANLATMAEAAIRIVHVDAAARLYPALAPWTGLMAQAIPTVWLGPMDVILGELAEVQGETGRARHHFEEAEAMLGRLHLEAPRFRARVDAGLKRTG